MMLIGQLAMVDAELLQDGGMQIRNTYPAFRCAVTKVICSSVDVPGPKTASCEPQTEGVAVVVASAGVL